MIFPFFSSAHQRACALKQEERRSKIESLSSHSSPLSNYEMDIYALSISQLVSKCKAGIISPAEIMMTYAKKALYAQRTTNCLTEIMFEDALRIPSVANWGPGVDLDSDSTEFIRDRPLLGVPVSLKDTVDIEGYDTTIGYSRNVGRPVSTSSSIVRLLQDAGALVHAKTTVPTALLSLETVSDVFGRTTNPYNPKHTPGGSTGGGAALLACGGSKIEIGTDLAGSVRIPAHFCGIWSLKGSIGRFPTWGTVSCMMGLEGLPITASPMAVSLHDLEEFWKRIVHMKPWVYDHSCIPLPWQPVDLQTEGRKLKWGVIWDDGVIPPSPACRRALSCVVDALSAQGHEVVNFSPPKIFEGLKIGYQLSFADGGSQVRTPLMRGESLNSALTSIFDLLSLPRLFKKLLAYFNRSQDPLNAELLNVMHPKSILEERMLIVQRDEYRAAWHERWADEGLDFVLTVPHPLPALKNGTTEKATLLSCGFTFIFSLLDYTAGVLPVSFVDKITDALPLDFASSTQYKQMSQVAKGAYSVYDADEMHGLPVGVQIAGRRLEEEKVLEGMKVVERALKEHGVQFVGRPASAALI